MGGFIVFKNGHTWGVSRSAYRKVTQIVVDTIISEGKTEPEISEWIDIKEKMYLHLLDVGELSAVLETKFMHYLKKGLEKNLGRKLEEVDPKKLLYSDFENLLQGLLYFILELEKTGTIDYSNKPNWFYKTP